MTGHYCPEGTGDDLVNCPTGTFANTTGLAMESECSQCSGTILSFHIMSIGVKIPMA